MGISVTQLPRFSQMFLGLGIVLFEKRDDSPIILICYTVRSREELERWNIGTRGYESPNYVLAKPDGVELLDLRHRVPFVMIDVTYLEVSFEQ